MKGDEIDQILLPGSGRIQSTGCSSQMGYKHLAGWASSTQLALWLFPTVNLTELMHFHLGDEPEWVWTRTCPPPSVSKIFLQFYLLVDQALLVSSYQESPWLLWGPFSSPSMLSNPTGPVARHAGWTGTNRLTQSVGCAVDSAP